VVPLLALLLLILLFWLAMRLLRRIGATRSAAAAE
jgi:hypothetical protein